MGDIKTSQTTHKLILILRESLGVCASNPKFSVFFSLLPSLPLLCFSVLCFEVILDRAILQTVQIIGHGARDFTDENHLPFPLVLTGNMTRDYFSNLIRLGLSWLVKFHVLELYPVMVIVHASSELYAGKSSLTFRDSIRLPHLLRKLRRLFITSLYVTFFSVCFMVGSIWLVTVYSVIVRRLSSNTFAYIAITAIYRAGSVGLLSKWLEISAVLTVSMVISILQETYGSEALVLAAHLSRGKGSDRANLLLNAMFFALITGSRLFCIGGWCDDRSGPTMFLLVFHHLVNLLRWVSFTVSFRMSEDRAEVSAADVETGRAGTLSEHRELRD
ncbi:hypothetical protein SAY86_008857 [Trapa natans]|uniref:Uncharacterized protein n=1 Tax=Trapa natans TaxID=22666 RepID=A0AAN7KA26_TRANT|nr:hypothetical protein SAY86_008857 [Trapa natans]